MLVGVVEIDAVVVGFVEAALVELGDGGALCRVASVYVEAAAREVGAGEALMELARSWASDRGAEGIDVAVLPGAREAKNFLESAGFAARLLVMHRPLAPGS
ncbi:MAG TPA: GNAT family N-acetyltransferase [Acidimicrobiales bacterium]|nr:GNAT family N-acetyltransferase [Acidimicrobiales bacterium]